MTTLLQAASDLIASVERALKAASDVQRLTRIRIHQLEAENAALRAQLIVLREERRIQGALGFVPKARA